MRTPILAAVMGATASGKTALAEALADRLGTCLVNADAFQVYRGLDVGTSKPTDKARYELIDIRSPDEAFGLGEWVTLAVGVLNREWEAQRDVIVVGGTGLYVRALFEEYGEMMPPPDPQLRASLREELVRDGIERLYARLQSIDRETAAKVDPRNPARVVRAVERALSNVGTMKVVVPPFRKVKLALDPPKTVLEGRIERRLTEMMQNGWVPEVRDLRDAGYHVDDPAFRAIGYRDVWQIVEGRLSLDEAISRIAVDTRRYAKRQRTWLRREPGLISLHGEGAADALVAEAMDRIA